VGELIGGEQRFKKPNKPTDWLDGPGGEVQAIDPVRNSEIIRRRLREAVTRHTVLMKALPRTPEEQHEFEALEREIAELKALESGQFIQEGHDRSVIENTGPPDPQGSGAA
jgi:hypothetical protein